MDSNDFRKYGVEMVNYICKYLKTLHERDVSPRLSPNYLVTKLPSHAPDQPEEFSNIMQDLDKVIMPGINHWQHPGFHAYYPSGNSFPSILGEMLSDALGVLAFSWV